MIETDVLIVGAGPAGLAAAMPESEFADLLRELEEEMLEAAEKLEFERAAFLRDRISELEKQRQ